MVMGPRKRYALAWILVITGAFTGSITADALDPKGIIAWYGLVFAVGAIFVLTATALTANIRPGELRKTGSAGRFRR